MAFLVERKESSAACAAFFWVLVNCMKDNIANHLQTNYFEDLDIFYNLQEVKYCLPNQSVGPDTRSELSKSLIEILASLVFAIRRSFVCFEAISSPVRICDNYFRRFSKVSATLTGKFLQLCLSKLVEDFDRRS